MPDQITPEVLWAQRSSSTDAAKNYIYLTLMVPDVEDADMKLDLQPTKLTFDGFSKTKKVTYHVELEFYAEIDPKESKINHSGRDVEMVLRKKELKDEFWPRLLKESKKLHFLKTDFDKWVDEDEQDAVPDDENINNMAGLGDGGFGGIDFSKLGAGGGGMPDLGSLAGGAGMPDMAGGDEEDSDDDEMPELEDEDEAKEGAPKAKEDSKIEEVS